MSYVKATSWKYSSNVGDVPLLIALLVVKRRQVEVMALFCQTSITNNRASAETKFRPTPDCCYKQTGLAQIGQIGPNLSSPFLLTSSGNNNNNQNWVEILFLQMPYWVSGQTCPSMCPTQPETKWGNLSGYEVVGSRWQPQSPSSCPKMSRHWWGVALKRQPGAPCHSKIQ